MPVTIHAVEKALFKIFNNDFYLQFLLISVHMHGLQTRRVSYFRICWHF